MTDGAQFGHCNNSGANFSILLEFGTEFDHMTADALSTFKVKE